MSDSIQMKQFLTMTMSDGSTWGVPVEMIARDRAQYYAGEFDDSLERSLAEDTLPLFAANPYQIQDWAVNNMNWSDFDGHQIKISDPQSPRADEFQEAWMSAPKNVIALEIQP